MRILRRFAIPLSVTLLTLFLLPANLPAQETQRLEKLREGADVPNFEKDVSVTLQLIDVTAIGPDGKYVDNLKREDFELLVNGEKREIRTFDAYSPGSEREYVEQRLEEGVVPPSPAPARRIVLFFDVAFCSFKGLKNAKAAAQDFLRDGIKPGDQLMVVSYDRSMKVHQEMTSDREKLSHAIEEIAYGFTTYGDPGSTLFRDENPYNIRIYLQDLKKFATFLKAIRGRKTLILLSEGFNQNIAVFNAPQYLKEALESFNDANCSVFSIDVYGLDAAVGAGRGARLRQARHDMLSTFAVETKGEFYRGSNNVTDLLLNIDQDISNYYVLGFYTEGTPDGSFREVSLRSARPGVRLVYRNGFFAPKVFNRMNGEERLAQLDEGFYRNSPFSEFDAGFDIQLYPQPDGSAVGRLQIEAPVSRSGKPEFEVVGFVYNANDVMIDVFHKIVTFPKTPDEPLFRHTELLTLDAGFNLVKVGVRDNGSGKRAYEFYSARLPGDIAAPRLSTIGFKYAGKDFVSAKSGKIRDLGGRYDVERRGTADPLAPLAREGTELSTSNVLDRSGETAVIVRVLGAEPGASGPKLTPKFVLRAEDGSSFQPKERDLSIYPVAGSRDAIIVAVLDFSDVPAGVYSLRASVEDTIAEKIVGRQSQITLR